jgi:hypothetical protein
MTLEQFFRLQPSEEAIVIRDRDGASRMLARPDVFRGSDADRGKAPGSRELLRGLVALRRDGKKKK